jgi:hypothetical protein
MSSWLLGAYLAGAVVALAATDDRWPVRVALAACWPLGPLAFVAVVGLLLAVAAVLWPALGASFLLLLAGAAWWVVG